MQRRLVFGGGGLHRIASAAARQRILAAAQDVGITAFDVAPAYGNGIAEREVGLALRGRRHEREIHTKFGIPVPEYGSWARHGFVAWRLADRLMGASARGYRRRDFSPDTMESSLESSLRRLQTDYVDCLFIHEPIDTISAAPWADLVDRAERMKLRGSIKSFGIAGPLRSLLLCPSPEGLDVVQTRCEDLPGGARWAAGRPLVAYGSFRAYRTNAAGIDFETFIGRLLASHERLRVILASNVLATVRGFRSIGA